MRKFILAAASAMAFMATPAMASTVVIAQCDPVTDGDADGCMFSGNINGGETGPNSYKSAEAAYNALAFPDITLNWLTASDDTDGSDGSVFADFGSITVNPGGLTGTFDLSGYNIEYYAVKYGGGRDFGNTFTLYEYLGTDGTGTWHTDGQHGVSHIAFFGTPGVVPEPATWAMMIAGFGLVGGAMRRRQTRPAIVTA